jgi:hypothetical protein
LNKALCVNITKIDVNISESASTSKTKVNKKEENKHILILFRIQYNNNITTIDTLQKLNINDKDNYIDYINNLIIFKDDEYKNESIKSIIFSYTIKPGKIKSLLKKIIIQHKKMIF